MTFEALTHSNLGCSQIKQISFKPLRAKQEEKMSLLTAAEQAAYNFNPTCTELNKGWAIFCENNVVNVRTACLAACDTDDACSSLD